MRIKYLVLVVSVLAVISGCGGDSSEQGQSVQIQGTCSFSADRVHIIGLTSIEPNPNDNSSSVLTVFLSLHDGFDSSIKVPASFQFELYRYVPRSSNPKGKRYYLSREFDLSSLAVNSTHWDSFLRAYKFPQNVAVKYDASLTYVLEVTCTTPGGRRLTKTFYLNKKKQ